MAEQNVIYRITAPLVQQSDSLVSIAPKEVPILPANMASDEEAELRLLMAVNFLRSGSPEVQFLLPYSPNPANSRFTKLMAILKEIERPDENFKFHRRKDRICSVTRTEVPPPEAQ